MTRQYFQLVNPAVRANAAKAIASAPDGYVVEIRQPTRTLLQNARLWALLTDVSEQVEWDQGRMTPDEWKDFFTAHLRGNKLVRGIDGRGLVAIGMRTSSMTKGEMGDLQELISAFGAERGVKWSAPVQPL